MRLLVATNRKSDGVDGAYGATRTYQMSYQSIAMSIPPGHLTGEIEWPEGANGDPARTFVTRDRTGLDETAFRAAVRRQAGKSGEVLVFIHGFNTLYPEAVFRMAQIGADSNFDGASILFSWPSEGDVTGYLRDRESANFSRDQLERFLLLLAATPGVRKINLLAHSMGNWLAVETLRQAKMKGDPEFGGKLGQVILAAPDIDSQVFQSQIEVIGKRNPPIVVFVSRNDRALALSGRIYGGIPRVGAVALDDPKVKAGIDRAGLTVIDLTDVKSADSLNHGAFAQSPPIIQRIGRQLQGALGGEDKPNPGVFVLDAAGMVLDTPGRLLHAVSGR